MRLLITLFLLLLITSTAQAALVERTVDYTVDGVTMRGFMVYDDKFEGKRPGIIVFPEFWGLNDYPRERARQLAQMNFIAFAADMYGNGRVAANREEASKMAGEVRGNRQLMRSRARAALQQLLLSNSLMPK